MHYTIYTISYTHNTKLTHILHIYHTHIISNKMSKIEKYYDSSSANASHRVSNAATSYRFNSSTDWKTVYTDIGDYCSCCHYVHDENEECNVDYDTLDTDVSSMESSEMKMSNVTHELPCTNFMFEGCAYYSSRMTYDEILTSVGVMTRQYIPIIIGKNARSWPCEDMDESWHLLRLLTFARCIFLSGQAICNEHNTRHNTYTSMPNEVVDRIIRYVILTDPDFKFMTNRFKIMNI